MYEDQYGEFICGYLGLKGLQENSVPLDLSGP